MTSPQQNENFKTQIQEHYQQYNLSRLQLDDLQSLSVSSTKPISKSVMALAASTLLAVSLYLLTFSGLNYADISKEIAYNHNSQMPMEVFDESLDNIQTHLMSLGFSLIESAYLSDDKWQLIGGRYCSISGKIAAQLKIKNRKTLKTYTFYQAQLPDQFVNIIRDKEVDVDGVNIKMWQEKGLLIGLAE